MEGIDGDQIGMRNVRRARTGLLYELQRTGISDLVSHTSGRPRVDALAAQWLVGHLLAIDLILRSA